MVLLMADNREKELSTLFQMNSRTKIRNANGTKLVRYPYVCEAAKSSSDFAFMTLKILKSDKEHTPSHTNKHHCTKYNQYDQAHAPPTDVPLQKPLRRKIKNRKT